MWVVAENKNWLHHHHHNLCLLSPPFSIFVLIYFSPFLLTPPPLTPHPPAPGFLMSLDDFYLLGSGLLMTQTSIGVFNASLYSQLGPCSLLAWQRVRLANSLAHSGEEWAQVFSKHNSGKRLLDSRVKEGFLLSCTVAETLRSNITSMAKCGAFRNVFDNNNNFYSISYF